MILFKVRLTLLDSVTVVVLGKFRYTVVTEELLQLAPTLALIELYEEPLYISPTDYRTGGRTGMNCL